MKIELGTDQIAFRERLRAWLPQALADHRSAAAAAHDEATAFATEVAWERALAQAGFAGLHWPEAYGGQGLGITEHYLAMVELGSAMAPEGANNIGRELVGPIILARGTEDQKHRFIPRIVACDEIWCQGFSEPQAGSDLAAVATRAVRDGDGWRLSGQKVWTSYAQYADWCILIARTDPDAPKHKGLTLFLVPMDAEGLTCRPIRQITGKHTFNELFLDDVRVPDAQRLGPVNEGWGVAQGVLAFERGTTRLYRQARFAAELDLMIDRLQDRADPERIGRLHAALEVLRGHNLRIVSRVAAGQAIGAEASLQKIAWSELHMDMLRAAQEMAGVSFYADPDWADLRHAYLQAQAETVYAGASEVQRTIIADRILNLPRQPRGDRA
ncbi:acyl-CoA dehydrogenase family protein [Palleronia abyssalis]|uniref:Acyl-CoA dehydrogenase FadE17 n=1 Tax=Palleronia abyssalis TaxID=1501240 RepID=A0A2R8BZ95_9RHOB|nr:acyl-CoA dehydrogenase family protein [Palleronia abyssalis]SPJ25416.1 Putative acyl-CoA dehydrogenase FadE17 [Palleronia abyssalis]